MNRTGENKQCLPVTGKQERLDFIPVNIFLVAPPQIQLTFSQFSSKRSNNYFLIFV